jgi:hypothetical protein
MSFDPYHKWLGIPTKDQPPHYYRLLGIELFESDPDVIAIAADQRMALVRSFQAGENSAVSQQLLNELAAARVCLLNPAKKADYDRTLRKTLAPPPGSVPGGIASSPKSTQDGGPTAVPKPTQVPLVSVRPSPAAQKRQPATRVLAGLVALGLLLLLGIVSWGLVTPSKPQEEGTIILRWPEGEQAEITLRIDGKQVPIDRDGPLEYRCKPGEHHVIASRSGLPPFEQRVTLTAGERRVLHPIWQKPVAEPPKPSGQPQPSEITETRPSETTAPKASSPQEPTPSSPSSSRATESPRESTGPTQLATGPETPPSAAREAHPEGQSGSKAAPAAPVAGPPQIQPPDKPPKKSPVPPEDVQQALRERLEQAQKLATARTGKEKSRLAEKLLALSKTLQKPEERFVVLRSVMELAAGGGDLEGMLKAIEAIGDEYDIDLLAMKQEGLKEAAARMSDSEAIASFVGRSSEVIEEALAEDRYPLALELATQTYRVCQKPQGKPFRKEVFELRSKAQRLSERWQEAQQAQESLKNTPDASKAYLVLGHWYCFAKDDWEQGLPHLVRGSDESLRQLAQQELDSPSDPENQVKLAGEWWEAAQKRKPEEKDAMQRHAGQWYKEALALLPPGPARSKAEDRLKEITKAAPPENGAAPQPSDRPSERKAVSHPPAGKRPQGGGTAKRPPKMIPETIDGEVRLMRQEGPYKLRERVRIGKTGSLLIERGTMVIAAYGAAILAEGTIKSFGEGEEFVRFRPENPAMGWDTISLVKNSRQELEWFDIRGADRGLDMEICHAEVKNCIFAQNKVGLRITGGGSSDGGEISQWLKNCLITNNLKEGVLLHGNRLGLERCTISYNGGVGLNMTYYGYPDVTACLITGNHIGIQSNLYTTHLDLKNSNIVGNRSAAIEVKTSLDFQCRGNYWGTSNEQQIAQSILDGRDQPGRGVVVYKDFQQKPIPDAGCSLKMRKER